MNDKRRVLLDVATSLGFCHMDDDTYSIAEGNLLTVMERVDAPPLQSMTITPLSSYEQAALIALGLTPVVFAPTTNRVELRQGEKQATVYTAYPEHLVRLERGELLLLRSGSYRTETVGYDRLSALSNKLLEYRSKYFTENKEHGNATRAAEHFVDWVRHGNKPTYSSAPTWDSLIVAIRTCAYSTGLRREYKVHTVTLSKIPNTLKLYIEV